MKLIDDPIRMYIICLCYATKDFRIIQRLLRGHDFQDAIQARLIEKNRHPNWKWKDDGIDMIKQQELYDMIDRELLNQYFMSLEPYDLIIPI